MPLDLELLRKSASGVTMALMPTRKERMDHPRPSSSPAEERRDLPSRPADWQCYAKSPAHDGAVRVEASSRRASEEKGFLPRSSVTEKGSHRGTHRVDETPSASRRTVAGKVRGETDDDGEDVRYEVGDTRRCRWHSLRFKSPSQTCILLTRLPPGSPVFVKRTNGAWTYAVLVGRSEDNGGSLVCALDGTPAPATKVLHQKYWQSCLRLAHDRVVKRTTGGDPDAGAEDSSAARAPSPASGAPCPAARRSRSRERCQRSAARFWLASNGGGDVEPGTELLGRALRLRGVDP